MTLFINGKTYEAGELIGYINKLEKENVELKEYNKYLKRKRQGGIQKQYNKVAIIKQRDDQLTKAKELLQKCLNTYLRDPELRSEVEEFLKENEYD